MRIGSIASAIVESCHPDRGQPAPAQEPPVVEARDEGASAADASPAGSVAPAPVPASDPCSALAAGSVDAASSPPVAKAKEHVSTVKMAPKMSQWKGTSLYPISPGSPLASAVAACFVSRATAKLRELADDPRASSDLERILHGRARGRDNPFQEGPEEAGALTIPALRTPERVPCRDAREEIFTPAKKSASHAEFLYPWRPVFPASGRADWSGATECYRSYLEGFNGYSIYGAKVGGEVVVLEIWFVPEII